MTLAEQADAATTRDALAAAARLCPDERCVYVNTPNSATGADLRGLQPDLTPEPTPSAERRTQPHRRHPVSTDQTDAASHLWLHHRADKIKRDTDYICEWCGEVDTDAMRNAITNARIRAEKAERKADTLTARLAAVEALASVREEAWDEGYSWGWSDAQEAHDVSQEMDRGDWPLCTPNPYREADQ